MGARASATLLLLSGLVSACASPGPTHEEAMVPEAATLKERLIGPWEEPRTRLKLSHDGRYVLDRIPACDLAPCPIWRERGAWSVHGGVLHLRPAPPSAEGRYGVRLDRSQGSLSLQPLFGGSPLVLTRRESATP